MKEINPIIRLFNIKYPIIQGGMVWCSGWKLASAVSNEGGLGLIGAGSMDASTLKQHIEKTALATSNPFGVNVPLIKKDVKEIMEIIIDKSVPIVFTSAGNPVKWTKTLQNKNIKVVHVVANTRGVEKSVEAGVDAIVAEGFEAGGHNGREETTTLGLIPLVRKITDLPLIAAGGIASGQAMLASMVLGADGVQIGSLFATSEESSAHEDFKNHICEIKEGETRLVLKKLIPVRLAFNSFYHQISQAESNGATINELLNLLGTGRAKMAIFDGNLEEGEIEIGQSSALINRVLTVKEIFSNLIGEYNKVFAETKWEKSKFIF